MSVCLCVCHKMCMFRNGFCSFTLCICTIFDQNAQKTKDANPIVQMMHHHLHDLSKHCSKHVNMHYFCMYTTREIQKAVLKLPNVDCADDGQMMHHRFKSLAVRIVCIVFFSNFYTKGTSGNPASRVFSSTRTGSEGPRGGEADW